MAAHAASFPLEEDQTPLHSRRQRALIASEASIIGRVSGEDRALVRRDGLGDALGIEVGTEDVAELLLIGWDGLQILDQQFGALVRRLEGLVFKRGARAGPLLLIAEQAIDEGG
jgi:hypothetical protein